jgi:serine/threonine-protein kinase RsbW
VRAALSGVGQVLELEQELFDDLTTAVSEACNNVVLYAYDGEPGPYVVGLEIRPESIEATVRDWGTGIQQVGPSDERMGVGLAVISALADRAEFISAAEGGTEVRMAFSDRDTTIRPLEPAPDGGPGNDLPVKLTGDVVVTLSPVGLLAGLLGRLARAVASRTHLSLDRFSDIYLITDVIAAYATSVVSASAVSFAVAGGDRRIELTVGPFPAGDGARLLEGGLANEPRSAIALRAGEVTLERVDGYELLHVVIDDRRPGE